MTLRKRFLLALTLLALGCIAFLLLGRDRMEGATQVGGAAHTSEPKAAPPRLRAAGTARDPEGPVPSDPAPAATPRVLRGQVVRATDGAGILGARVGIHAASVDAVRTAVTSMTDAQGGFALEVPMPDSVDGALRLTALAPGFEIGSIPIEGETSSPVLLRLAEGAVLSGRVVDDQGLPVVDAVVFAVEPRNRFAWPFIDAFLPVGGETGGGRAWSTADGSFAITGLRAGSVHLLSAHKTGFSSIADETEVSVRPGDSGVTVVLRPTCRVLIRLVDAQSREPVRASFARYTRPPGWQQLGTTPRQALMRGDELDAFASDSYTALKLYLVRFPGPTGTGPAGQETMTFHISAPGYESTTVEVPLALGASVSRDVELVRTEERRTRLNLRGRFEGGLPYSGSLALGFGGPSGKISTAALLRFTEGKGDGTIDLPAGRWTVSPSGTGQTGHWWRPAGENVAVDLRAAPAEHAVDLLLRGGQLDITVVDGAGRTYSTFDIQLTHGDNPGGWWRGWGSPEKESGSFTLPPSHVWCSPTVTRLYVSVPGLGGAEVTLPSLPTDGTRLPILLELEPHKVIDWDAVRRQIFGGAPLK